MSEPELRSRIVELAKEWVSAGVPYRHRGISRIGCDCTGFLIGILREMGYLLDYALPYYPFDWCIHRGIARIETEAQRYCEKLPAKERCQAGDLLLFHFGRCNSHAGILIKNGVFAHSYNKAGKCVFSVLRNSMWEKRWMESYRLINERLR